MWLRFTISIHSAFFISPSMYHIYTCYMLLILCSIGFYLKSCQIVVILLRLVCCCYPPPDMFKAGSFVWWIIMIISRFQFKSEPLRRHCSFKIAPKCLRETRQGVWWKYQHGMDPEPSQIPGEHRCGWSAQSSLLSHSQGSQYHLRCSPGFERWQHQHRDNTETPERYALCTLEGAAGTKWSASSEHVQARRGKIQAWELLQIHSGQAPVRSPGICLEGQKWKPCLVWNVLASKCQTAG